jgi:hypothetical protein
MLTVRLFKACHHDPYPARSSLLLRPQLRTRLETFPAGGAISRLPPG